MSQQVLVFLAICSYGLACMLLLAFSMWFVNHFWIDPLNKQNNNNRNHITEQPITAKQNNYKDVA